MSTNNLDFRFQQNMQTATNGGSHLRFLMKSSNKHFTVKWFR